MKYNKNVNKKVNYFKKLINAISILNVKLKHQILKIKKHNQKIKLI